MGILNLFHPRPSESAALKELAADHAFETHSSAARDATAAAKDARSIASRTKIAAEAAARMVAAGH